MKAGWAIVGGLGLGAGLMYWLDPDGGRRRRARTRQKLVHGAHEVAEEAEKGARDLAHRTRGALARGRSVLRRGAVPDDVVVERVRARLGRACSHPSAIDVRCEAGTVFLSGPILRDEVDDVLSAVSRVRGVDEVQDRLEVHDTAENVPALQGGAVRRGQVGRRGNGWTPAARLVGGAAGAALLGWGVTHRGPLGWASGAVGTGVLVRSVVNRSWRRLVGIGAGRRAVDVRKTIHVDAPVEEVFAFWRELESFPRFMGHVKEVRRIADGRYHWTVTGPGGTTFSWEAEVTRLQPNELLAWRSVPGSSILSDGVVRFKPARGGTELEVRLSYNPPGGVVGHGIATLLGADPKKQMDEDLLRLKSLIERGKATAHGETVTRDEVLRGR